MVNGTGCQVGLEMPVRSHKLVATVTVCAAAAAAAAAAVAFLPQFLTAYLFIVPMSVCVCDWAVC